MINRISHQANKKAARGLALLLCMALALTFAPSALAAQTSGGKLGGAVTVTGGNASGINVELRQRSNNGEDKLLATTTTNDQGLYEFLGQPSAPNDAFFYVKFTGGTGTLASWYSFPIIYISGSEFTVPSVEMADVKLNVAQNASLTLPATLQWNARRSGETYRVFVYAVGKPDKAVLDSGSLGMRTEFQLAEGSLPNGSYEAVVQVRDAVVGYGQSRARFTFTIGTAAPAAPAPSEPAPQPTSAAPSAPAAPAQQGPPSLGQSVPPEESEDESPDPSAPQQPLAPGQAAPDPGSSTGPSPSTGTGSTTGTGTAGPSAGTGSTPGTGSSAGSGTSTGTASPSTSTGAGAGSSAGSNTGASPTTGTTNPTAPGDARTGTGSTTGTAPGTGSDTRTGSAPTAPQAPAAPAAPPAPVTAPTTAPAAPAAPGGAGQAGDPSSPSSPGGAGAPGTQPGGNVGAPGGDRASAPASASVQVNVTGDRTEVQHGQDMVYQVEVTNPGPAPVQDVVVVDDVPPGAVVDANTTSSTQGTVFIANNRVTVQMGTLEANSSAVIKIPVSMVNPTGGTVANQASVHYAGAEAPVQSNSFVAMVTSPQAAPVQVPAASQPQAPAASQPQAPAQQPAAAPPASNSGSAQQAPPANKQGAPIPRTGGGFPVVFAVVVLMLTLFVRYLRGRTYRRV